MAPTSTPSPERIAGLIAQVLLKALDKKPYFKRSDIYEIKTEAAQAGLTGKVVVEIGNVPLRQAVKTYLKDQGFIVTQIWQGSGFRVSLKSYRNNSYHWILARIEEAIQHIRSGKTAYTARAYAHQGFVVIAVVKTPGKAPYIRVYAQDKETVLNVLRHMRAEGHSTFYGDHAWRLQITPRP